eukprot:g18380.t1
MDVFRRLTNPTLKKLYRFVLKRLVGRFLDDDISLEQIDVRLGAGRVELTDLNINAQSCYLRWCDETPDVSSFVADQSSPAGIERAEGPGKGNGGALFVHKRLTLGLLNAELDDGQQAPKANVLRIGDIDPDGSVVVTKPIKPLFHEDFWYLEGSSNNNSGDLNFDTLSSLLEQYADARARLAGDAGYGQGILGAGSLLSLGQSDVFYDCQEGNDDIGGGSGARPDRCGSMKFRLRMTGAVTRGETGSDDELEVSLTVGCLPVAAVLDPGLVQSLSDFFGHVRPPVDGTDGGCGGGNGQGASPSGRSVREPRVVVAVSVPELAVRIPADDSACSSDAHTALVRSVQNGTSPVGWAPREELADEVTPMLVLEVEGVMVRNSFGSTRPQETALECTRVACQLLLLGSYRADDGGGEGLIGLYFLEASCSSAGVPLKVEFGLAKDIRKAGQSDLARPGRPDLNFLHTWEPNDGVDSGLEDVPPSGSFGGGLPSAAYPMVEDLPPLGFVPVLYQTKWAKGTSPVAAELALGVSGPGTVFKTITATLNLYDVSLRHTVSSSWLPRLLGLVVGDVPAGKASSSRNCETSVGPGADGVGEAGGSLTKMFITVFNGVVDYMPQSQGPSRGCPRRPSTPSGVAAGAPIGVLPPTEGRAVFPIGVLRVSSNMVAGAAVQGFKVVIRDIGLHMSNRVMDYSNEDFGLCRGALEARRRPLVAPTKTDFSSVQEFLESSHFVQIATLNFLDAFLRTRSQVVAPSDAFTAVELWMGVVHVYTCQDSLSTCQALLGEWWALMNEVRAAAAVAVAVDVGKTGLSTPERQTGRVARDKTQQGAPTSLLDDVEQDAFLPGSSKGSPKVGEDKVDPDASATTSNGFSGQLRKQSLVIEDYYCVSVEPTDARADPGLLLGDAADGSREQQVDVEDPTPGQDSSFLSEGEGPAQWLAAPKVDLNHGDTLSMESADDTSDSEGEEEHEAQGVGSSPPQSGVTRRSNFGFSLPAPIEIELEDRHEPANSEVKKKEVGDATTLRTIEQAPSSPELGDWRSEGTDPSSQGDEDLPGLSPQRGATNIEGQTLVESPGMPESTGLLRMAPCKASSKRDGWGGIVKLRVMGLGRQALGDFLRSFSPPQEQSDPSAQDKHSTVVDYTDAADDGAGPLFISCCDVGSFKVKIDYQPRAIRVGALQSGDYLELLNLFPLEGVHLTLQKLLLTGVSGWDSVTQLLLQSWVQDIASNQLHKFLAGTTAVRPLVTVGKGVADLVLLPVEQYRRDGRVFRGLRKGTQSFLRAITIETLHTSHRVASYISRTLDDIVTQPGAHASLRGLEYYDEQPTGVIDSLEHAYDALAKEVQVAAQTIIAIPYEDQEEVVGPHGRSYVRSVARALPLRRQAGAHRHQGCLRGSDDVKLLTTCVMGSSTTRNATSASDASIITFRNKVSTILMAPMMRTLCQAKGTPLFVAPAHDVYVKLQRPGYAEEEKSAANAPWPTGVREEINSLDDAKTKDLPTVAFLAVGGPVVLHKTPQFVLLGVCNNSDGIIRGIELDPLKDFLHDPAPGFSVFNLRYAPLRVFVCIKTADDAGLRLEGLDRGVVAIAPVEKELTIEGVGKRKFIFKRRQLPRTAGVGAVKGSTTENYRSSRAWCYKESGASSRQQEQQLLLQLGLGFGTGCVGRLQLDKLAMTSYTALPSSVPALTWVMSPASLRQSRVLAHKRVLLCGRTVSSPSKLV